MVNITLGNGDVGITRTVDLNNDEVSITFSQLEDTGSIGEPIGVGTGDPICKIEFDNIEGLDNLIYILQLLRKDVYRSSQFYMSKLP